ncbi:MAG: hypothetical protein R3C18_17635 [Planctomycetaceae bacterium]
MAQGYSEKCKAGGVKLELTWFAARKSWKKYIGKLYYFKYPNTKQGYEQALLALVELKAELDNERPHAEVWQHHKKTLPNCQKLLGQIRMPEDRNSTQA